MLLTHFLRWSPRPIARALQLAVLLMGVGMGTGCRTVSYYSQAVRGQYQVLARRQSCEKLIANPDTSPELKAKLRLAAEICDFAERELKLPARGDYRRYADLGREYVVWNACATPEFSLEPKTWWYPIVGSLDYRGFFSEPAAQATADRLKADGFDACVEGVEAYSTLGWFSDPLLNTFINHSRASLAEILFHEIAHQRAFAAGDTDFNEAFATAVGQEGVHRWLRSKRDDETLARYEEALQRNAQFVRLVAGARKKLEVLYGDERNAAGKIKAAKKPPTLTPEELRREKQLVIAGLRRDYERLKGDWGGYAGFDDWFEHDLNNAKLNSVATYYDLVPAFQRLLVTNGGDLPKFYAAVKRLMRLPKAERHRRLQSGEGGLE